MALGGGTFTTMNKILPGAYINFISAANATATLSERGTAAIAMNLSWGPEGEIFEATSDDFAKNSMKIFGYAYADEAMKPLRDLYSNAKTVYFYRLNSEPVKATSEHATAKYGGVRGNDIQISLQKDDTDQSVYILKTFVGGSLVDEQAVKTKDEIVDNDWVTFNFTEALSEPIAGENLTTGTDGTEGASDAHQTFIGKLESYPSVNAVGYAGTDEAVKKLYAQWVIRMRDEVGIKLQAVLYNYKADSEAVVNVKNKCEEPDDEASLIYWVTGVIAGTAVNASATNKVYNGEYNVNTDYTQKELEAAITAGEFTLHRVGDDIRILTDIDSLTTVTETKGELFKANQSIRVMDQIATDIAHIFVTKYLGVVPNDNAGRVSFWNDAVKLFQELETIRAIEDFDPDSVTVTMGDTKKDVVCTVEDLNIVNAMERLYMSVVCS